MGGLGSGKWRRKDTRKLITGAYRLDVGNIADELREAIRTGEPQAKTFLMQGRLLGVLPEPDSVRLIFDAAQGEACITVTARVEKRPCRFGGERFFFACPMCERPRQSLFRQGDNFLCRVCSGLVYPFQNERKVAALNRAFMKARGRLVRGGQDDQMVYPARPKGMHRANYEALAARQLALFDKQQDAELDHILQIFGHSVKLLRKRMEAATTGR